MTITKQITNPARLIEGGHCQGYGMPCASDTDEGSILCDDCNSAYEFEAQMEIEGSRRY